MTRLSYKDFKRHINDIKALMNLQDRIDNFRHEYNKSGVKDEFEFYFPTGIDNIIQLLALLTNDKDEWISYWIYELDFGKKANELKCTDGNGNKIPMNTIEDLWAVLHSEG